MPRSSGVYSRVSGTPYVYDTDIDEVVVNSEMDDIASALTQSIARDGQTTITANIPFSNNKITGLGAGTARTDAASLATIQDGTGVYVGTVGGTADVITLTPSPAIASYAAGQLFAFIASGANTTSVTVNVSGLGAKAITKNGTTALVAGDIPSGFLATIRYDGTRFQLVGAKDVFTGGALTSDITMSGASIIEAEGAAVTAAATTDIWATDGNTRHVTGNTTITSFGTAPQAGARMKLIFDGTPQLTQGTNLNLNGGGANITIEADDWAEVYADTTTQFDVVVHRKSGLPVTNNTISILNTSVTVSDTGTDGKITKTVDGVVISEETDTSRTSTIDGGTALIPEFKVRAWCVFDGTTAGTNSPTAGGNITNITRNATGDYTLNFTTALPDGNYEVSGSGTGGTTSAITVNIAAANAGSAPTTKSTTQVRVYVGNSSGGVDCKQITIKVVR